MQKPTRNTRKIGTKSLHIFLLNGPPSSGKDTSAELLQKICNGGKHIKFAESLKNAVHHMCGLRVPHDYFENCKSTEQALLFGKTPRECYIAASENWAKTFWGSDFFGRVVERQIKQSTSHLQHTIIISDAGFFHESNYIVEKFGKNNCTLIRLHRAGYDFSKDSRGYIELPEVQTFDVMNTSTIADLEFELKRVVSHIQKTKASFHIN